MKKIRFTMSLLVLALAVAGIIAQDFPGFGTVPDETPPELAAACVVDGSAPASAARLDGRTLSSGTADEGVLLVRGGVRVQVRGAKLDKAGGDTSSGGQSNFYGLNAAVVAAEGGSLVLKDVTVDTNADGANAVFATGSGSTVDIRGITVRTRGDSSRGLDATYGGVIAASNVSVATEGAHCAAFATDRGEGTVTVDGGTACTAGEGSPVIYSTGDIRVKNLEGIAGRSEMAVIEGKNSITVEKSRLTGGSTQGIMLYQSMSGDAGRGVSRFAARNSTLTSTADGPFFYVTNTQSEVELTGTTLAGNTGVLVRASGNNGERGWGQPGANGGTLALTASRQQLAGGIECDAISRVRLNLGKKASFTGAVDAANEGTVDVSLAKNARWTVTADSYVNELADADAAFANIASNGHTVYYNRDAAANRALGGRTVALPGGGRLAPATYDRSEAAARLAAGARRGPRGEHGRPEPVTIAGVIKMYGNAPFAAVGFVTDDGREYTLRVMRGGPHGGPRGAGSTPPGDAPAGGSRTDAPAPVPRRPQGKRPGGGQPPQEVTLEALQALAGTHLELAGFVMDGRGPRGGPGAAGQAGQLPPPGGDGAPAAAVQAQTLKDGAFMVLGYTEK